MLAALRGDRGFLMLMLYSFPLLMVSSQLISTLSIHARDHVGMSGNQIGFLYTLNGVVVILLQLPVSRLVSRWHLARRLSWGAMFYAVGYFSLAFCSLPLHAFLAVAVFTFGEMLVFPSLGSGASRMAPPGMLGRYMGMYGLAWGLGYSLGPFFGSVLYGWIGGNPVLFWGTVSLSALLAATLFPGLKSIKALAAA